MSSLELRMLKVAGSLGIAGVVCGALAAVPSASAAPVLTVDGTPVVLVATGVGSYSAVAGTSTDGVAWSGFTLAVRGLTAGSSIAEVQLGVTGLNRTSLSTSSAVTVGLTDTGFLFAPGVTDYLQSAAAITGNDVQAGDQVVVSASANNSTNLGLTPTVSTSPLTLKEAAGLTYAASAVSSPTNATTLSAPYGLSLVLDYTVNGTSPLTGGTGDVQGGTFTADVTTAPLPAGAAVPLPGSGELSLIGGVVLVGGLVARRRLKV